MLGPLCMAIQQKISSGGAVVWLFESVQHWKQLARPHLEGMAAVSCSVLAGQLLSDATAQILTGENVLS